jgi:cytidyltransferase-like protein
MVRIFVDGVFDYVHKGHREHFDRVKHLYDDVHLIVGVISDDECTEYKRKPAMNQRIRLELVSKDKHVDGCLVTPLIITREFIEDHEIDFVYHAFANREDEFKQSECFEIPRQMGIFRTVPYVTGVSSTSILTEWNEIWQKKGLIESNDLQLLNGYEGTTFEPAKAWETIKNQLTIEPSDEVLEVGCGAGNVAQHIENSYVGVDPSQSLILKHLQILNNAVCVADAADLPFADNAFDHVICIGVFAYFKDKEYTAKAISEMERIARKGIYIGNIRHTAQGKRTKHVIKGTTTHLLHDINDFPEGFEKSEALYDGDYYFCCYKKFNY